MRAVRVQSSVVFLLSLGGVVVATATTLSPGDIVVSWGTVGACAGGIARIDPATGEKNTLITDATFDLLDIAFGPASTLLATDTDPGRLLIVNVASSTVTALSTGGMIQGDASSVAVEPTGEILVGSRDHSGLNPNIARIDPVTGDQDTLAWWGPQYLVVAPSSVGIRPDSTVLVKNAVDHRLIAINPHTREQTLAYSNLDVSFVGAPRFATDEDGSLYFASTLTNSVVRLDADLQTLTTVSSGGLLTYPIDLAIEWDGNLVVLNDNAPQGSVVRVSPSTGEQTLVTWLDCGGMHAIEVVPGIHNPTHTRTTSWGSLKSKHRLLSN